MPIAQIENLIRYVTNAEGKTTDVLGEHLSLALSINA